MPKTSNESDLELEALGGGSIGDFGNRNVTRREFESEEIGPENWTDFPSAQEAMAERIIEYSGATLKTMRVLILVDLQGIYLNLHEWLREQGFPVEGGLVLSRFATFQILDVFDRIKKRIVKASGSSAADFETLLEAIAKAGPGGTLGVNIMESYVRFKPEFDLFYAPSPLRDLEAKLNKYKDSLSLEIKGQLQSLKNGVVRHRNFERDYAAYDDFIAKLKANPEYSSSHEGFFSHHVGPKGLTFFDEKEVDTRIVIRAMDALHAREADVLCILSSDQDFLPLHDRASGFGVSSFQADLANFWRDDRVAKKLRKMGAKFLRGNFLPTWPLKVIIEAAHVREFNKNGMYQLTENEIAGLCKMNNQHNELQVLFDGGQFSFFRRD